MIEEALKSLEAGKDKLKDAREKMSGPNAAALEDFASALRHTQQAVEALIEQAQRQADGDFS